MAKFKKNGKMNGSRFFQAFNYIGETYAWSCLPANAKAAWLEIGFLYNGCNNGHLAVSRRALADRLNISKNSAARAINALVTYGFLEVSQRASFSKKRRAAEYRLTHQKCDRTHAPASMDFKSIQNEEAKP